MHRWPKSIHSQVEAVFHAIRSVREAKLDTPLGIRGFGTWQVYKHEAHNFAMSLLRSGNSNLLETQAVRKGMANYLEERLVYYVDKKRSRRTMQTLLSALGKLEYAINNYIGVHGLDVPKLDVRELRLEFYARSRKLLRKSSKIFDNRAYPDPLRLIEAIKNGTYQLQACLQFEGGLRTEGVGGPSNRRIKNPLTKDGLLGFGPDPVSGCIVGIIASKEKGGKLTRHFISVETYKRLEEYIGTHGSLECDYSDYVAAINEAAQATGQHALGRGTHGLKFNFAQERQLQCVSRGMSHEQALQQVSLECSHFRLRETLTYTRG